MFRKTFVTAAVLASLTFVSISGYAEGTASKDTTTDKKHVAAKATTTTHKHAAKSTHHAKAKHAKYSKSAHHSTHEGHDMYHKGRYAQHNKCSHSLPSMEERLAIRLERQ